MPQVDRCARCKYGRVRRNRTLCMGCEEFLAWEAAEQQLAELRREQEERRQEKLQRMNPRVRPLYYAAEAAVKILAFVVAVVIDVALNAIPF